MDELYGNAWGESSSLADPLKLPQPTWTSPKLPVHDDEADLAAPSWSTGTGIGWNEPSDESHGFKWSADDSDLAWAPGSVYHTIPIQSRTSSNEPETAGKVSPSTSNGPDVSEKETTASTPSASGDVSRPQPISAKQEESFTRSSTPHSRSSSPDGSGTFETGLDVGFGQVSSGLPGDIEGDTWSSPWVGSSASPKQETSSVDEWEIARRQKEQLDRRIPPEVLAHILAQCEDYFEEVDPAEPSGAQGKEDPWMSQWRDGLEVVENLEALIGAVVPELTLQPAVQFTKTHTAKNMAAAVRLTKNLPLAKNSPFSLYLATKGSTTWETAVKRRKLLVGEDVIPVGWRIVEKQPAENVPDASKGIKQGGSFFSFWGRKHSKSPSLSIDSVDRPAQSPTRASSVPPSNSSSPSHRMSQESVVSQPSAKDDSKPPLPTPELPIAPSTPGDASSPAMASPSSIAHAADSHADASQTAQPPASAVSRFLTRFSRKRSSLSTSSPRNSLALSSDDLDILSDIVPTAQDVGEDNFPEILKQPLSNVLKTESIPPTLPPPPSAPVSKPQVPALLVSDAADGLSDLSSRKSLPLPPPATPEMQDLLGLFESADTSRKAKPTSLFSAPLSAGPSIVLAGTPITPRLVSPSPPGSSSSTSDTPDAPSTEASLQSDAQSQPVVMSSLLSRAVSPSAPPKSVALPGFLPASSDTTSDGGRIQSKGPSPLFIPPPPSIVPLSPPLSSRSSSSSRSEVPLGQLYPDAETSKRMVNLGPSATRAAPSSAFPGPARSRGPTPIMVEGPSRPASRPPLLPPPPSFQASTSATTPEKDLFGDADDDFADFQTSSQVEPATSSVSKDAARTTTLPGPEHITLQSKLRTVTPPAGIPPPVGKHSPLPISSIPPTPQPLSSDSLNDEFSSFFSSSSSKSLKSSRSQHSALDTTSFGSEKSFFKSHDSKADSKDFFSLESSSALQTPSPPRPPAKAPKPALSVAVPRISIDAVPQMTGEEKKHQHQRTLSLMERAAARPGQWPAPPSPLPQPLHYPGDTKQQVDLMGEDVDESFGAFQADPSALAASGFPFIAPLAGSSRAPSPSDHSGTRMTVSPAASHGVLPAAKTSKTSGGLSAQDLSFFESL